MWFDENEGYNRELRYATNQRSVFVDEQEGPATLKHIIFEKGFLQVNKNNPTLQKFLSLHPQNNKKKQFMHNPTVVTWKFLIILEFS